MASRPLSRLLSASVLMVALGSAPALAQAPPLADACKACHGREGISSSPGTPNLAGQKADYLAGQLAAFKSKDRKNDLMAAIAGQLSDADMKGLAQYWSQLPGASADAHGQAAAGPAIPSRTTFPANFPAGFTAYQSLDGDGFVTKRYANAVAWRAARAGQPLPDGSVILQVTYDAKKDASGTMVTGPVKSYAAMESRAGWGADIPVLLRNENWDYATFGADRARRDGLNQAPCLACHKPAVATSYVFTLKLLQEAAAKPAR